MLRGNPSKAQTGPSITDDRDTINIKWGSTDTAAIKLGSAHASSNTLDDQGTLQLGYRRNDHYNGSSEWAVRIDRFTMRKELDAEVVQLVEHLEEVLRGSC
jgi:hypothetical protein